PAPEPAPPSPEQRLAEAQQALDKTKNQLLRVAADFENYRRRSAREIELARRRGQQHVLRELLPVLDNLERAAAHVGTAADLDSLATGVRLVREQFVAALGRLGVERIRTEGQPFDPTLHESIQQIESAEHPAGTVVVEAVGGYRLDGELLRPALVVVSKGPPAEMAPDAPAPEPPAAAGAGDEQGAETAAGGCGQETA
ncbi:MAG: nucleotide exchange factor GrpE, partial [Deltaproteobacteria bacterium]|nr:nucleotide exchange factor GrpE [Deltaproteobacteria bacterium]